MNSLSRFSEKTRRQGDCLMWTGAINKGAGGYGWFRLKGRETLAHRASWELHKGEIPKGEQVLHKCDVRLCVNPDHLFLGSNGDNVNDKVMKGRQARGEGHIPNGLSEDVVLAIRSASGTTREIGARFGVSSSTVSLIKRRKTWRHLN